MKTKLFAWMMFFAVTFVACEEDGSDEFCSNPDAECPDGTSIDASACCTDDDCYWTYNSTNYDCDGDDCSDVLDLIIDDACEASAGSASLKASNKSLTELKAELAAVTQKLLAEARAASGCN